MAFLERRKVILSVRRFGRRRLWWLSKEQMSPRPCWTQASGCVPSNSLENPARCGLCPPPIPRVSTFLLPAVPAVLMPSLCPTSWEACCLQTCPAAWARSTTKVSRMHPCTMAPTCQHSSHPAAQPAYSKCACKCVDKHLALSGIWSCPRLSLIIVILTLQAIWYMNHRWA